MSRRDREYDRSRSSAYCSDGRSKNSRAFAKNGLVWKLQHAVHLVSAVTPEKRLEIEKERPKLLSRKGANKDIDEKDPTMLPQHQEV